MKNVKRIIASLLATVMLLTVLPFNGLQLKASAVQYVFPVIGNYNISTNFSNKHGAIDIAGCAKKPVVATASGTVIRVDNNCQHTNFSISGCAHNSTCGNCVYIKHDGTNYVSVYGHLYPNSISVSVGQRVQAGQQIGLVGSSGMSTGYHLHFEIRPYYNDYWNWDRDSENINVSENACSYLYLDAPIGGGSTVNTPNAVTDLHSNKKVYNTSESIEFTWSHSLYSTSYWVYLWKDGAQLYAYNAGYTNSFTQAPSGEGYYTLYIRPENQNGYNEASPACNFVVTNSIPEPVTDLTSEKTTYKTNESACFTWSDVPTAQNYWVYLWKDGVQLYQYNCGSATSFTQGPSAEGKYTLIIKPQNINGINDSSPWYRYEVCNSNHNHEYISKTISNPTCTKEGINKYICSSCGDTYTEAVAALGHDYVSAVTASTCTEQGFTTYTCSRCKDSYKADYVKAKGHTDGNWKITKQPSFTEEGVKTLYCKNCRKAIKTEVIPKLIQGKVNGVKINDISMNYKESATIKPTIKADDGAKYTVKYESSDTKVATVDNDGKIYGAKKGNATITCTVTDSYGNAVTDKCNVNVGYSGIQWVIIILLFGWIWYI